MAARSKIGVTVGFYLFVFGESGYCTRFVWLRRRSASWYPTRTRGHSSVATKPFWANEIVGYESWRYATGSVSS